MPVRMTDISRATGVSQATVSLVLNDKAAKRVSAKTISLIKKTASQLGFQPNRAARILRGGQSFTIGVCMPSPEDQVIGIQVAKMQDLVATTKYQNMFFFWNETTPKHKRLPADLFTHSLDALIAIDPGFLPEKLPDAISVFSVAPCEEYLAHDLVTLNYSQAIEDMVDRLVESGHTKIGSILRKEDVRYKKLQTYLKKKGLDTRYSYTIPRDNHGRYQAGIDGFNALWSKRDKPTVIHAHNDTVGIGVIHQAFKSKVKIPDQLSLVGWDNLPYTEFLIVPLSTYQPKKNIMEELFKLVLNRIQNPELPRQVIQIDMEFIERKSISKQKRKIK